MLHRRHASGTQAPSPSITLVPASRRLPARIDGEADAVRVEFHGARKIGYAGDAVGASEHVAVRNRGDREHVAFAMGGHGRDRGGVARGRALASRPRPGLLNGGQPVGLDSSPTLALRSSRSTG